MNVESNKSIARRFIEEVWNERKLEVADEIFASNCITHQLRSGSDSLTMPRGPQEIKHHIADWLAGFPDLRFTIEQIIAEGDRVTMHCVARGTHEGPWLGIAASHKVITIQTMLIQRITDGHIVEDWVLADFLGVFQQMGLIEPTSELVAGARSAPVKAD